MKNNKSLIITNDIEKIDISVVYNFLSRESSWAQGRSFESVKSSLENSLCFGVIDKTERLHGFGRVISDYSVFAWILDVFVLEEFRGKGIAKSIMRSIITHPKLQGLHRWGLVTGTKHALYEQFGFTKVKHPEMFMELGYKQHKKELKRIFSAIDS